MMSEKMDLVAGRPVMALVPTTVEEYWRIASVISKSGLAPKTIATQEAVMVAMMYGAELGLAPMQALRSIAVINGNPALWGDGLVMLARRAGCKIEQRFEGEVPDRAARAVCVLTRPDGERVEAEFSWGDALTSGLAQKPGPWKQFPRRMMAARARAWAIRDGAADLLGGVGAIAEELEDADVTDMTTVKAEVRDTGRLRGRLAEEAIALVLEALGAAETEEQLERVWDERGEPLRTRLSENAFYGLSEMYAGEQERVKNPAAPDLDAQFKSVMGDE